MMNERKPQANRGPHLDALDLEVDNILADVHVCVTNPNGETEAVRPWITVVIDRSTGEHTHVGVSAEPPTVPVSSSHSFNPARVGRIERWFGNLQRDLKAEPGFGSASGIDPNHLPTLEQLSRWVLDYAERGLTGTSSW